MMNYISPFIMIAIGIWHYTRHGVDLLTIIPIALGCFTLYLALFNHPLLERVMVYLTKLWFPIGQFITIVLFIATFVIVFAPVGIILRLLKKDILDRKLEQNRLSYWMDRPEKESNNYTQQF